MTTVGILGGGQLARMLALAGAPLGVRFLIVDSASDACAGQVAPLIAADWRDFDALAELAQRSDVVTFDFENVPADTAHWLSERTKVFPNARALALAQDRLAEKSLFRELGLDTPAFATVDSRDDLQRALDRVGCPAVLKTRRLGYDGKGQFRIRSADDADAAWAALGGVPLILEAWVAFEREVSVIAVRSRSGELRTYPLVQNWHADGILSASLAPAPDAQELNAAALGHARAIGERLDYVGVFALELFVVDWPPARQRDGAARAQFRALDDRRRAVQPVRKPRARGTRPAARRYVGARHERDAELDRRASRCHSRARRAARALARLRQVAACRTQGRTCDIVRKWKCGNDRAPGARCASTRPGCPGRAGARGAWRLASMVCSAYS